MKFTIVGFDLFSSMEVVIFRYGLQPGVVNLPWNNTQ